MIIGDYRANTKYMNQKMLAMTELFNKTYFWMEDGDGTTYLVPVGEDGNPDFTR